MISVFYGCARRHRPFNPCIAVVTNDIDKKCYCSLTGDIEQLLNVRWLWIKRSFDGLIFTPPCNYYSRANWRKESSPVAQSTKHLLPLCLKFAVESGMPFLVENVQNKSLLKDMYPQYQFILGGHTFWSNFVNASDFFGIEFPKQNKQNVCRNKRDGNFVVDFVVNAFLQKLADSYMEMNSLW